MCGTAEPITYRCPPSQEIHGCLPWFEDVISPGSNTSGMETRPLPMASQRNRSALGRLITPALARFESNCEIVNRHGYCNRAFGTVGKALFSPAAIFPQMARPGACLGS